MRGERWEDTEMPGGIAYRLVFNRSDEVTDIILRHMPTYERSNITDVRGSLRIDIRSGRWSEIVEFARSKGDTLQKPFDFHFDRERDRVFYSLDGTTFSIPRQSVEEIDERLASLPGPSN